MQELKCRKCMLNRKSKCKSETRKKRTKHDGSCSPYKGQIPGHKILGKLGNIRKMPNLVGSRA